jgi:hypothetical protein
MNRYVIRYTGYYSGKRLRQYFQTKKAAEAWKRERPYIKAGIQKL